jgi:hypothetical protein
MKKLLSTFIVSLFVVISFAQNETPLYKQAVDSFKKNYNSENYAAMFSGFTTKFQQKSPIDKTQAFVMGLKKQVGKLLKTEFIKCQPDHCLYKSTFERTILALDISVDDTGKIDNILIERYKEDTP